MAPFTSHGRPTVSPFQDAAGGVLKNGSVYVPMVSPFQDAGGGVLKSFTLYASWATNSEPISRCRRRPLEKWHCLRFMS